MGILILLSFGCRSALVIFALSKAANRGHDHGQEQKSILLNAFDHLSLLPNVGNQGNRLCI